MNHRAFGAAMCRPPLHSGGRHRRFLHGAVETAIVLGLMGCYVLGVLFGLVRHA